MSGQVTLKVKYGSDIRKAVLPTLEINSYSAVTNWIAETYNLHDANNLLLKYMDGDRELITLINDDDLQLALSTESLLYVHVFSNSEDANGIVSQLLKDIDQLKHKMENLEIMIEDNASYLTQARYNSRPASPRTNKSESIATIQPSVHEEQQQTKPSYQQHASPAGQQQQHFSPSSSMIGMPLQSQQSSFNGMAPSPQQQGYGSQSGQEFAPPSSSMMNGLPPQQQRQPSSNSGIQQQFAPPPSMNGMPPPPQQQQPYTSPHGQQQQQFAPPPSTTMINGLPPHSQQSSMNGMPPPPPLQQQSQQFPSGQQQQFAPPSASMMNGLPPQQQRQPPSNSGVQQHQQFAPPPINGCMPSSQHHHSQQHQQQQPSYPPQYAPPQNLGPPPSLPGLGNPFARQR